MHHLELDQSQEKMESADSLLQRLEDQKAAGGARPLDQCDPECFFGIFESWRSLEF